MKKTVRLLIFNEPYWDKGLIYTQNILPLKKMADKSHWDLELISFTSLPKLISERKRIRHAKKELEQQCINIIDFPVLFYPTRFMTLFYFLLPWYFLNVWFYIKYLAHKDKHRDVIYSMRSYQVSLGFLKFYGNLDKLIFDLRTDFIEENINRGLFRVNGLTVKYWRKVEKEMLTKFNKSLFISAEFRKNVLDRNQLNDDIERYPIIYNPIDYRHFQSAKRDDHSEDFLYTGSLGHWNNLSNYLDFFLAVATFFPKSKLIICTASPKHKVEPILEQNKYDSIRDRVLIYYNIPYESLPIYYAKCKYGLQIMKKLDTRVGVKFIEYIAAGVMPIVHENVQGAAKLVKDFGLGIVFNDYDLTSPDRLALKIAQAGELDEKSINYTKFRENTDINCIAEKLQRIYA